MNENQNQEIKLKFQGHYNENEFTLNIPTKVLKENEKVRIKMICNPYACSDDGK